MLQRLRPPSARPFRLRSRRGPRPSSSGARRRPRSGRHRRHGRRDRRSPGEGAGGGPQAVLPVRHAEAVPAPHPGAAEAGAAIPHVTPTEWPPVPPGPAPPLRSGPGTARRYVRSRARPMTTRVSHPARSPDRCAPGTCPGTSSSSSPSSTCLKRLELSLRQRLRVAVGPRGPGSTRGCVVARRRPAAPHPQRRRRMVLEDDRHALAQPSCRRRSRRRRARTGARRSRGAGRSSATRRRCWPAGSTTPPPNASGRGRPQGLLERPSRS